MQQLVMGETLSPKLAMSPPLGAADALSRSAYHASSEMMREGARFVGLRLQRYAELELALMRSPNIFAPRPTQGYQLMARFRFGWSRACT